MEINVNGKTEVYGLMGCPIEHTMSPLIHNYIAAKYNHNQIYIPFEVNKNNLKEAVIGLYVSGIRGLNVTVPFKEEVITCLQDIDKEAELIGAVNTLQLCENGYKGYNTDVDGLFKALLSDNVQLQDRDIVILGAGGAAKAVAYLCARERAKSITILNRSINKANNIVSAIKNINCNTDITALQLNEIELLDKEAYIAFQTTPIGMNPNINQVIIEEDSFYDKIDVAVDLIYNPSETVFLNKAKQQGAKTANGLKMLIYQAILAYEIWHDIEIKDSIAKELVNLVNASNTSQDYCLNKLNKGDIK